MLGCCVLDIWGMTWKTTATLLLLVPVLLAPLARCCARAGLSVLLLERAEIPGSKNLSGGRLYTHALAELLPQFHLTAPLERRITHESLSLLTPDGATTFSSLQPGGESWVYYVHDSIRGWLPKPKKKVSNASPVRR